MTYFVVPVLVVEKLGPIDATKRSMSLMYRTWGEALVGKVGLGLFLGQPVVIGDQFAQQHPALGQGGGLIGFAVDQRGQAGHKGHETGVRQAAARGAEPKPTAGSPWR